MKKIERKIREYFGKSIYRYLGRDVVKIVKNVPGRVTKVKVFSVPNLPTIKELSLYLGEIIIFKEMSEDEKEEIIFKEHYDFDKFIELNMKRMANRRKKRRRKKLRKRDKILAEREKRRAGYSQGGA